MKLRLLKVVVQPVFVQDDGESLTERAAEPTTVSAANWPDFATLLEEQRKELEAQLAGEQDSPNDWPEP